MKRHRLKVTKINEVSLVDRGDNPTADVVIHKRATPTPPAQPPAQKPTPILKQLVGFFSKLSGKPEAEIEQVIKDYDEATTFNEIADERKMWRVTSEVWTLCSDLSDAICRTLRDKDASDRAATINTSLNQFVAAITGALPSWLAGDTVLEKAAELDELEKAGRKISAKRLEQLKAARDALSKLINEAETSDNPGSDDMSTEKKTETTTPSTDEVLKGASPEVVTYVKSLEQRAEKAESTAAQALETANKERDARELAELRKRAETELGHLPGTPDEKAVMLKDLKAALGDEKFEKHVALLKVQSDANSTLFKEVGAGGANTASTAFGKIQAEAQKLVEAGTAKTIEEAIGKVAQSKPELYSEYEAERNGR